MACSADVVQDALPAPERIRPMHTVAGVPLLVMLTVPVGVDGPPVTVTFKVMGAPGFTVVVFGVAVRVVVLGVTPNKSGPVRVVISAPKDLDAMLPFAVASSCFVPLGD